MGIDIEALFHLGSRSRAFATQDYSGIGQLSFGLTRPTFGRCLTQKDFAGEKERIFLINRTEHPRLAERVRCLCVGCDVTWGPPCQALVTQLPANRRR